MANFAVPPMPPPVAPLDTATEQEISLWRRRISGYLGTLNTFIEEVAEAYIANSSQLGTDIITADQIAASAVNTLAVANSAITSLKIADGSILEQDLEDSAVTSIKLQNSAITNLELVALTVDAITSHASVGAITTVSFSISRTKRPLISPSTTATMWFLQLGNVTTASADVQVFNVNGPTSATIYISYH